MNRKACFASILAAALISFESCTPGAGPGLGAPTPTTAPDIAVSFQGLSQEGGLAYAADTTALVLSFDVDPTTLSADDITVSGAAKGALSGTGPTRTLAISDIEVADGDAIRVEIASPRGYLVSGSPRSAAVYRQIAIGKNYPGGKIGYILQPGDPGYDASLPHGLIVSPSDQHSYCSWARNGFWDSSVPGTGTAIGSGSANTDLIIARGGTLVEYAALVARLYRGGGFSDWYLPSKDELIAVTRNRDAIGMTSVCYWSSSERDASDAYSVWWDLYSDPNGEGKYGGRYVRAVRDF